MVTDHAQRSARFNILWVASLVAAAAWWALFQFQGVTDVGYVVERANPSAFHWIRGRWMVDWSGTHYAINFVAPFLALFLLWRRRAELKHAHAQVSWAGFVVFALGLALHLLGAKAQQTRLSLLGMITMIWGLPWFALGPDVGRALRYPMFGLIFMTPLNFFDYLLNPFRVIATKVAAVLASGFGIAVKQIGSILVESETGAWSLDMANSTSGIFALLSLCMWTVLLGDFLYKKNGRKKFWLFVWTPILFLMATILRGLTLCLLAESLSGATATTFNARAIRRRQ
ncbi:MAG: exosortase/archaeosortase family protein [Kiritimatiellae bacterium]|nr:exosortase/archaeosortase family protein [Kiritimatiellia bacterium]